MRNRGLKTGLNVQVLCWTWAVGQVLKPLGGLVRPIFQVGPWASLPGAIMLLLGCSDTAGKNAFSLHLHLDNLCQVGGREMKLEGLGSWIKTLCGKCQAQAYNEPENSEALMERLLPPSPNSASAAWNKLFWGTTFFKCRSLMCTMPGSSPTPGCLFCLSFDFHGIKKWMEITHPASEN